MIINALIIKEKVKNFWGANINFQAVTFNFDVMKKRNEKPFGTFNGFDLESKLLNRIDYIFTKNLEVLEYKHIQKKLSNKLWPSDHLPIFISIN